jgi:hypothetical protein
LETNPKRTPPKATKRPMAIAAQELPASRVPFLGAIDFKKLIVWDQGENWLVNEDRTCKF